MGIQDADCKAGDKDAGLGDVEAGADAHLDRGV
jgi:hypothetical protein